MTSRIQHHLDRIVGGGAVRVEDIATETPANPRIRIETARATYELPTNRTLSLLGKLPDRIGVEALREELERAFPSAR